MSLYFENIFRADAKMDAEQRDSSVEALLGRKI